MPMRIEPRIAGLFRIAVDKAKIARWRPEAIDAASLWPLRWAAKGSAL